jgi:hypothetical protein
MASAADVIPAQIVNKHNDNVRPDRLVRRVQLAGHELNRQCDYGEGDSRHAAQLSVRLRSAYRTVL